MLETPEHAGGSPSLWLRNRSKIRKLGLQCTPAEERQIRKMAENLENEKADARQKAAGDLGKLIHRPQIAEVVAEAALKLLIACLREGEPEETRLAVLSTLRALAENGQANAVGFESHSFVDCLTSEETMIQRKTAVLFRIIAEEGAASMLVAHVSSLMNCFEADTSLLAPLEALSAIASSGEATSVAKVAERLVTALKAKRAEVRVTACRTIAAIARGGGKTLLQNLGLIDTPGIGGAKTPLGQSASLAPEVTLFKKLMVVALDDTKASVRLAAADALRCLPEAEPGNAEALKKQRILPLIKRVQSLVSCHDGEVTSVLCTILGLEEGDECVICQRGLHYCGGPERLPCGHEFHADCIQQWFEWKEKCGHLRTCPLCRWTEDRAINSAEVPPDFDTAVEASSTAGLVLMQLEADEGSLTRQPDGSSEELPVGGAISGGLLGSEIAERAT